MSQCKCDTWVHSVHTGHNSDPHVTLRVTGSRRGAPQVSDVQTVLSRILFVSFLLVDEYTEVIMFGSRPPPMFYLNHDGIPPLSDYLYKGQLVWGFPCQGRPYYGGHVLCMFCETHWYCSLDFFLVPIMSNF